MNISISSIRASRAAASRAYSALNDRGEGYDPSDMLDGLELIRGAENTSDVTVYAAGCGGLVLVGTDGSGGQWSEWAVDVDVDGVHVHVPPLYDYDDD